MQRALQLQVADILHWWSSLQKASTLDQLHGENALLKRQLAAAKAGHARGHLSSDSNSGHDECQVDVLRREVVRISFVRSTVAGFQMQIHLALSERSDGSSRTVQVLKPCP